MPADKSRKSIAAPEDERRPGTAGDAQRADDTRGGQVAEYVVPAELRGVSIVLRGNFNPLIFRPDWMVAKKLVSDVEIENAIKEEQIDVIHPDVVLYRLQSVSVQVRRDFFSVESNEDPFVRIYDLTLGCFAHLPETPLTQMGINFYAHYPTKGEEHWHRIGDTLAPKEPWGALAGEKVRSVGMRTITMEQKPRLDGRLGHVHVRVEPSAHIKFGMFVHVNDHYEVADAAKARGATELMETLHDVWDESIRRARQVSESIVSIR